VAEGLALADGLSEGFGAATAAGAASARDDRTAEVTSRDRLVVCF
jgi:hypothetical protein